MCQVNLVYSAYIEVCLEYCKIDYMYTCATCLQTHTDMQASPYSSDLCYSKEQSPFWILGLYEKYKLSRPLISF